MIRWERQQDGNWLGLSGELLVATVAKEAAEKEQWLWTITALKRPKGWRKGAGHRSSLALGAIQLARIARRLAVRR